MHLTLNRAIVSLLLALAIVLPLGLAAPAGAQGTSGMLPDPISTRELMRYADRLGLSDQQRRAIEGFHDEYRDSFRELRDSDIQGFMGSLRQLEASGGMPQRSAVERFFQDMARINSRIASLDDRLLSRIQTVCTDEQLGAMHRVRMARERARFGSQQMMTMTMMGRQVVDLSELILDIEMSPDERVAIDGMLAGYESRLTNRMNAIYRATITMFLDMFDALERMGFTGEPDDPEEMERMMEAVQGVMMEIMAKSMEIGREMQDLNRRTFASLGGALSPRPARALRNAYFSKAYPEVPASQHVPVLGQFETALTFEGLTDEQRQAIRAQEIDFQMKHDRLVDELVAKVDAFHAELGRFGVIDPDGSLWSRHEEAMRDGRERMRQLQNSATELLKATLGEDRMTRVVSDAAERAAAATSARTPAHPAEDQDDMQRHYRGPDWFVAAAIDARDLPTYARMLGLSGDERALLEALHSSYLERYTETTQEPLKKIQEAQQEQWAAWREGREPDAQAIDRVYERRAEAREIIAQVDASFFDDVALALMGSDDDPRLARVKLLRAREVNSRGVPFAYNSEIRTGVIDLSRIIRTYGFTEAEIESVDDALGEYERALAGALERRYVIAVARQRAEDRWNIEMRSAGAMSARNPSELRERYMAIMGEHQKDFNDSMRAVAELNRHTLEKLMAGLPDERALTLRDGYRRSAYPTVYRDPAAMDGHLHSAARLEDLTTDQRTRLNEMAAEYRAGYAQLSERMIELNAGQVGRHHFDWVAQEEDYWMKQMEMQNEMSRLRFDRNELNARAITRLRSLLSPDQLRQLGELPEPPGVESAWGGMSR